MNEWMNTLLHNLCQLTYSQYYIILLCINNYMCLYFISNSYHLYKVGEPADMIGSPRVML
jgi:hypothetical protein